MFSCCDVVCVRVSDVLGKGYDKYMRRIQPAQKQREVYIDPGAGRASVVIFLRQEPRQVKCSGFLGQMIRRGDDTIQVRDTQIDRLTALYFTLDGEPSIESHTNEE